MCQEKRDEWTRIGDAAFRVAERVAGRQVRQQEGVALAPTSARYATQLAGGRVARRNLKLVT